MNGEVNEVRWKFKADRRELTEQDGKIGELRLKVQLLANDSERVAWLQARWTSNDVELTASRVAAS